MNKTAMHSNLVRQIVDLDKPPPLTARQKAELDALSLRPIDYSDIAPSTATQLRAAVPFRTALQSYRPTKTATTIRVDSDVLVWLKSHGKGYQTRLNAILRDAMLRATEHSM